MINSQLYSSKHVIVLFLIVLIVTVAHAATALQPGEHKVGQELMSVVMDEWQISLNKHVFKRGSVTIVVENHGKKKHEIVVLKTNLGVGVLPMTNGKVDEIAAGKVIGEFDGVEPGEVKELTFPLEPGHYVLFCNLVETDSQGEPVSHYMKRMRTEFKVD